MTNEATYSAEQAATANSLLRSALGLDPQRFTTAQFVGMISEEIDQLREAGKSDEAICRLLHDGIGVELTPGQITMHYAGPDQRDRGGA